MRGDRELWAVFSLGGPDVTGRDYFDFTILGALRSVSNVEGIKLRERPREKLGSFKSGLIGT